MGDAFGNIDSSGSSRFWFSCLRKNLCVTPADLNETSFSLLPHAVSARYAAAVIVMTGTKRVDAFCLLEKTLLKAYCNRELHWRKHEHFHAFQERY